MWDFTIFDAHCAEIIKQNCIADYNFLYSRPFLTKVSMITHNCPESTKPVSTTEIDKEARVLTMSEVANRNNDGISI